MAKMKFADRLKNFFGIHKNRDKEFFEELSDLLIEGDLGAKTVFELVDELEKSCHSQKIVIFKTDVCVRLPKSFD